MRKINRTYKFRLYPNKAQADLLARHFGCARFVYNYFLNQRKEQYRLTGKSDNYYAQAKALTALKKQEATAWLKEVNSQTLQFAIRSLEVAYTNFFQKLSRITDTRRDTSAVLQRRSSIFPERLKAAEGLKTKNSKLPGFTRRLLIAVPTTCISVLYPLCEDMIPFALRI